MTYVLMSSQDHTQKNWSSPVDAEKPRNEGILSSNIQFPRVAYKILSVTLKNDPFFLMFPHFLLVERLFSCYADKEFKDNYI